MFQCLDTVESSNNRPRPTSSCLKNLGGKKDQFGFCFIAYHEIVGSGLLSTLQSRLRASLPSTKVVAVALIVTFGTTGQQQVRIEMQRQSTEIKMFFWTKLVMMGFFKLWPLTVDINRDGTWS